MNSVLLRALAALVLVLASPPPSAWTWQEPAGDPQAFHGSQTPLPPELRERMERWSWRPGCPVDLDDLRLLSVTYWGYDGRPHQGLLTAHKDVARELLDIFQDLYAARFPIERMRLIEDYRGDDGASMADNNTSGFNCRVTQGSDAFSRHSWGLAVDLNPLVNPYARGDEILPEAGAAFLDRSLAAPGMITHGDACYRAFASRGWQWGGEWLSLKDYQHFQKPVP